MGTTAGTAWIRSPLVAGALALTLTFVAAGAALGRVWGQRIEDDAQRAAALRAEIGAQITLDHHAERVAAGVQGRLDDVRRIAEALARECGRVQSVPDATFLAVAEFAQLPGVGAQWTESSCADVWAAASESDPAVRETLVQWSRRLAPVLRSGSDRRAGLVRATIALDGVGLVGCPTAWAKSAARDTAVATEIAEELVATDLSAAGWRAPTRTGLVYAMPVIRIDGLRIGTVRVEVDRAALGGVLDAAADGLGANGVLVSGTGDPAAATQGLTNLLGLAPRASDGEVAETVRALLSELPGEGDADSRAGTTSRGLRLSTASLDNAPFAVLLLTPVVAAGAPGAPMPPAAGSAGAVAAAFAWIAAAFGLVTLGAAIVVARAQAARLRPVLESIAAQEAGLDPPNLQIAGDDAAAHFARWMNGTAKRLRHALTRGDVAERRAQTVIDQLGDGVLTVSADGLVQRASRRFADLIRRPAGSLPGRRVEDLLVPESIERWSARSDRLSVGEGSRFEVSWDAGKPPHVRTLATCIPLRDARGGAAGSLVIVSDLTERERVQDEVARAEKLRALGEMAGGVAHDFNNVLTVILGNTQFLLLEELPPDTLETLRAVERAALDGTETVRRVREFAKHRAVSVNAALVSPDHVVGAVMEFVRKSYVAAGRARAAEYRVTVERRSRRRVRGDADQLREALAHIVENAFDAMPDGGKLRVETFDRGEDSIAIRVTDTGMGMTPEQARKVFDPFYSTKEGGRCTGLGLSIAFGIVRAHRGRIDVRSEPGCGSTFAIVLPAAAGAAAEDESGEPGAATAGPAVPEPRLLLVAEDRTELDPLVAGLGGVGVFATAASADAAVALLSGAEIFNVLVVDRDLGSASGWELARQARAARDDLRIVLVTGPEEPVSETQARNAGIDRVLVRPMDARDLQAEAFAMLASPRERSAAPEPASVRNRMPAARRVRTVECVASATEVWARGAVRPAQELATEGPDDTSDLLVGHAQDPRP